MNSVSVYNNRELSWLDFNERVLMQAADETVPLCERLKFLAIHSANLDEFFMIRVAGLKDLVSAGYKEKRLILCFLMLIPTFPLDRLTSTDPLLSNFLNPLSDSLTPRYFI